MEFIVARIIKYVDGGKVFFVTVLLPLMLFIYNHNVNFSCIFSKDNDKE